MAPSRSTAAARKAVRVKTALTDLARRLGPQAKLPTVRELCRTLQVSVVTLDAALGDLEDQSIIHRRQGSGIYTSAMARTRRIGLVMGYDVFSEQIGPFGRLLMRALVGEARLHDRLLSYYVDDPLHDQDEHGPSHLALDARNGRIEGLMLHALSPERTLALQGLDLPCVNLADYRHYAPRVALDMGTLIDLGVEALRQRARRRIALVYPQYPDAADRAPYLERFELALARAGLCAEPSLLVPFRLPGQLRALQAIRHFRRAWEALPETPDALLSLDDNYTAGALHALEGLGVTPGAGVSVASHANKGSDLFGAAPVIRLEFDPVEVARAMIETLDPMLDGGQPAAMVREISPRLVVSPPLDKLGTAP